jgi:hypothetical protein
MYQVSCKKPAKYQYFGLVHLSAELQEAHIYFVITEIYMVINVMTEF